VVPEFDIIVVRELDFIAVPVSTSRCWFRRRRAGFDVIVVLELEVIPESALEFQ